MQKVYWWMLCVGLMSSLPAMGCGGGTGGDDMDHDGHAGDGGGDGDGEAGDGDTSAMHDVAIAFEARVGDEAFDCGATFEGLGTSGATVIPLDFRLYVHDVRLVTTDGDEVSVELAQDGAWQVDDIALLDFEDSTGTCTNGTSEVRTEIVGTVPHGQYAGLRFEVGVPAERNHENPAAAPSPLNLTMLHWNWAAGYKHMRLDFLIDKDPEDDAPFNFHLGSTKCTGDPEAGDEVVCDNDNRPSVSLEGSDMAADKVVIDYANLVEGEDMGEELSPMAPGCMSGGMDMECVPLFPQLGLDMATGAADAETQQVFYAEPR